MDTILENPFLKRDFRVSTNTDCLKLFSPYNIYQENGELFAAIVHEKSNNLKLLDILLSHKRNSCAFKITSVNGNTLARVKQSNAIWRRSFRVFDKDEKLIYKISPKIKFNNLSFNVINKDEMHVAKIVANSAMSSFAMHDIYNHILAIVHKKNIHDTFFVTEYASLLDKNMLLATAVCVSLYTGAYK
ncbi:hypothetical protein [Pinibacter soli]|uniref:Uncharacterized protein n=1 Tax=Pinibacter soli TaxID=3044211 RepID=A0ABT6RIW2_9BACT|nr:hypothetical protein [Pinibacter soli]MDI3322512.1 hypothetical protein [Pinibacter soli]